MSIKSSTRAASTALCCNNPQPRIDSPEPPARPLATIDGIFAAAALPEDHPHALKWMDKKPELDASIIRSPNLASKIKLQFRRRSVRSLGREKEGDVDEDAVEMSSQDVLDDIAEKEEGGEVEVERMGPHRFGSVDELKRIDTPKVETDDVRPSVLRSLGQTSSFGLNRSSDVTNVAARGHGLTDISNESGRPLPSLPKSFSSPILVNDGDDVFAAARRSHSEVDVGDTLYVSKKRNRTKSADMLTMQNSDTIPTTLDPPTDLKDTATPACHVRERTQTDASESQDEPSEITVVPDGSIGQAQSTDDGVRLQSMDISQQLRCLSQLSDVADDEVIPVFHNPWHLHHREGPELNDLSGRGRHSRLHSSSGLDSATVPTAWGRVRSPVRDTASSVYSRPASADIVTGERAARTPDVQTADMPIDLNALFSDWPLKRSNSVRELQRVLSAATNLSAAGERHNKPLPPTPVDERKDSGSTSFVTANNNDESGSVRFISPLQRASSIPSKSSSSTLTRGSKQSRFFERFSPPKKAVRKRRSIFKFLRPGSRKQQVRSISSPVLNERRATTPAIYDGPSDDPALLTVQYELSEQPSHMNRSVSMSHLTFGPTRSQDAASHLTAPPMHALQRRPTLADYERNLSVVGDDRRRPSAINIHRVKEIQEDDRRESTGLRKRLSRAHPLKDDANPLMAQALEKHQQEKALFRSASKQRDSVHTAPPTPVFCSSPFATARSSFVSSTLDDHSELLDPLEKGEFMAPSSRNLSVNTLLSPDVHLTSRSRRQRQVSSANVRSAQRSSSEAVLPPSAPKKNRIGTTLESWSRYPSHSRSERCGSAGRSDAVITRDFAVDVNHDDIQGNGEIDDGSSQSKTTANSSDKRSSTKLPKSRSTTFSGIVRYYSNLFTSSGFYGQNRRTSVTTAGKLEYPELEMLPPQVATESSQPGSTADHLARLREHIIEDAAKIRDFVADEESKLEGYVKKEEKILEGFVREEEHRLSDFVKKEEQKLEGFVKLEEDKLLHHSHHDAASPRKTSPFRHGSIFSSRHRRSESDIERRVSAIARNEIPEASKSTDGAADGPLRLDRATTTEPETKHQSTSKAEVWSDLYKQCLTRSVSMADVKETASTDNKNTLSDGILMPPPALRPVKPRTPDKPKLLDPGATIRRFPSVTVVDDRKGHYRSISLLSVKTSRSMGFERSSTHDLLELIQVREREEREKLLHGAVVNRLYIPEV